MVKLYCFLASVTVALALPQFVHANSIQANWWSNQTSSSSVLEFREESLRLEGGSRYGVLEGTVDLPSSGNWLINFFGHTDETTDLPAEYVNTYINGILIDESFNSPPGTNFSYVHSIAGSEFDYRFEFSSPSASYSNHMVVDRGTVVPVPEPSTLCLLGIAALGSLAVRRRCRS